MVREELVAVHFKLDAYAAAQCRSFSKMCLFCSWRVWLVVELWRPASPQHVIRATACFWCPFACPSTVWYVEDAEGTQCSNAASAARSAGTFFVACVFYCPYV